jgi:hypothetical protein
VLTVHVELNFVILEGAHSHPLVLARFDLKPMLQKDRNGSVIMVYISSLLLFKVEYITIENSHAVETFPDANENLDFLQIWLKRHVGSFLNKLFLHFFGKNILKIITSVPGLTCL